jgi:PKD repeat protein
MNDARPFSPFSIALSADRDADALVARGAKWRETGLWFFFVQAVRSLLIYTPRSVHGARRLGACLSAVVSAVLRRGGLLPFAIIAFVLPQDVALAQGALTNGASQAGVIQVGGLDTWTIQATTNDMITVSIGKVSGSDPNFFPWIRLLRPNGTLLGNSWNVNSAQLYAQAPLTGTYTVLVAGESYNQTGPGNYTLTVSGLTAPVCTIGCSASVPGSGQTGQSLSFTSSATPSNCSGSVSYLWNFGDGQTSGSQNPSHAYLSAGTYSWTLTASVGSTQCQSSGSVTVPVATTLHPLTPCRVIDTRVGSGALGGPALAPNATRNFNVAGVCGIPSDAVSISANVTVTNNTGSGELVLFPSDVPQPGTSTISFRAFRTRANNALVYLAATTPTFSVYNNCTAPVDFVVDVNGYFQ